MSCRRYKVTRHRKYHDTKALDQVLKKYLKGLTQGWSTWMETNFCNEWLIWTLPWTHNDYVDGLAAFDLKLIPRNRLNTFNVVRLTGRQRISQLRYKWHKVSCSRVVYCFLNKGDNWILFLSFSPTITGKYLFIFDKLEGDKIFLFV